MYAIIESGGKQYLVAQGEKIQIEKVEGNAGDAITFDKVLLTATDKTCEIGKPYLSGKTISGTITKQGRGDKVHVLKYKAKSKYRRKIGHRQAYTEVQIAGV